MSNIKNAAEAMQRLEELKLEITGKKPDPAAEAKKQSAAYSTAFWDTMHTGMATNALKSGSDGAGGYLVPDTYEEKLLEALTQENVLRKISHRIQTSQRLRIPVVESMGVANWIMENQPMKFIDAEFGEIVLDAYKLGTSILVTDEMLEDNGVNLEKHILDMFSQRIGVAEEKAFIKGDGKGKPLGLIYQAELGAESELEKDITMDDMIELEHSLKEEYRRNAVWVMSEDAYHRLRRIPHYRGHGLWRQNLAEGEPVSLFGYPIYICKAMDDVVPGGIPVLFGDFSYFWIGDRGKRVIKRLVERYADRGQVAFLASQRVDAKLVLPEAVKMLRISGTPAVEAEE